MANTAARTSVHYRKALWVPEEEREDVNILKSPQLDLNYPKIMSLSSVQRLSFTKSCIHRLHSQCLRQLRQPSIKLSTHTQPRLTTRTPNLYSHQGNSLHPRLPPFHGTSRPCRFLQSWSRLRVLPSRSGVGVMVVRHVTGEGRNRSNTTSIIYITAIGIFMVGAAYAGVPLYRMFCQASGLGGQAVSGHDVSKVETMLPVKDRQLVVRFNADTASSMQWNFKPQQSEVRVIPGETALAFYTARNPTNKAIIGISTYNVIPFEAGQYFNKIECFCFEEQRLNPHEQVDMPVFFYIDPEFAEDPKLADVDQITLSYTFFEAKEGLSLPLPGYVQPTPQPAT